MDCFSLDGSFLLVTSQTTIYILDAFNGSILWSSRIPTALSSNSLKSKEGVLKAGFLPSNGGVYCPIIGSSTGEICIWNNILNNLKINRASHDSNYSEPPSRVLKNGVKPVDLVAFNHVYQVFASSSDEVLTLWIGSSNA